MFSKALPFSITIPRITSETKTKAKPSGFKRATVIPRSASAKITRSRLIGSLIPYFSIAAMAAVVFVFGFHLFMVNAYATKGYELKKYELLVRQLSDEQKNLLVRQSELGSISKVNDVAGIYGMVPVTSEEFLNTSQLTQK